MTISITIVYPQKLFFQLNARIHKNSLLNVAPDISRFHGNSWTSAYENSPSILCLIKMGLCEQTVPLIKELQNTQFPDGHWASSAFLRLTNREITEPWKHINAGAIFVDEHSLFTTSTVLNALAQYRQLSVISKKAF